MHVSNMSELLTVVVPEICQRTGTLIRYITLYRNLEVILTFASSATA